MDRAGRIFAAGLAAVLALMVSSPLHAQNLDAGKPPDKLFADGCAACHRSPRGLAKGRFSLTLAWFLRDHYASSSDTAKSLADYLVSVDSAPTTKPRAPARRAPASGSARPHP